MGVSPQSNAHRATAFIDPFYSSGVHIAVTGGLSAAITIAASIRGSASEDDAHRWHTAKVGTAYTRFVRSRILTMIMAKFLIRA